MKRVLVTNDDGIEAEGIATLIAVAGEHFEEVFVVAPRAQRSAVSHAITLNRSFRIFERYGERAYGLEANPADCVFFALRELLESPPDMVLSGINLGPNLGYDTLYSGTVAAAREGLMNGIPSIAFSLAATSPVSFNQAREAVGRILAEAVANGIPGDCMLNVNIPSQEAIGPVKGYRFCSLGRRVFDNRTTIWKDPMGLRHGWIGGREFAFQGDDDSDCAWMSKGFVTLTPLTWNLAVKPGGELDRWRFAS